MKPPPFIPTGSGPLAEFARWVQAELRALQPVPAPGLFTSTGPRGVAQRARQRAGTESDAMLAEFGEVRSVAQDTLTVQLDSGPTVAVQKPESLAVSNYAAYNGTVITDFQNGLGIPTSPPWWHWFTEDYLMRTVGFPDEVTISGWTGGMQSRYRLVFAPFRDGSSFSPPRWETLEVVWPPYFVSTGGVGGVVRGGGSRILVGRIGGAYHDLNVDARRWKPEAEVSAEQYIQTTDIMGGVARSVSTQRV